MDDPGQHHANGLALADQEPEEIHILRHQMQGHIEHHGLEIFQLAGDLLPAGDLDGETRLLPAAKVVPHPAGTAQLGQISSRPDGHELGQSVPAHGVDGCGGEGVARLDVALHIGAAEGSAAGLAQTGRKILRQQRAGAGHLRRFALNLADIAVGVPDGQLAALFGDDRPEFHAHQGIFHGLVAFPGGLGPGGIFVLILPDAEHLGALVGGVIAVGEALTVESVVEGPLHVPGHETLVQSLAVDPGDGGHILGLLHPALQLQGCHAHGFQILDIVDKAVILQAQGILLLASAEAEGQTAGLGAAAPVAGAAADGGGEVALTGVAHTQCAVGKDLDLDGGIFADVADLLPAQLPAQHHTGASGGGAEQHTGQAVDGHLGGTVDGHPGGDLPAQLHHAQILDDEGIHTGGGRLADQVAAIIHLPVGNQGIQGQMHLNTTDMAVFHRLGKGLYGKILRTLSCVKAAATQINGVRTVLDSSTQGLHGPGGGK